MKLSSTVLLGVALYLLSPAEAGISTNTPFNGVTWNGGDTENVVWVDDGKAPKLAEIGLTSVDLMKGDAKTQAFVTNIGKVQAAAKEVQFKVPKDVGPVGNDYFIKYTAGTYTAFSGTFTIDNVDGKAPAPAPAPGAPAPAPGAPAAAAPGAAAPPTDPNTPPKATDPKTAPNAAPNATGPKTAPKVTDPNATDSKSPSGAPKSTSSAAAATGTNTLPESISSSDSNSLLPSFSGVAAAAVAFAFTYLY